MSKKKESGALEFLKTTFNFTIVVAVGCPAILYLLNRWNVISDMGLGYIFLPGYMLMLIVILLMRIGTSIASDISEDLTDDK